MTPSDWSGNWPGVWDGGWLGGEPAPEGSIAAALGGVGGVSATLTVAAVAQAPLKGRKRVIRGKRLVLPGDADYVAPAIDTPVVEPAKVEAAPLFTPGDVLSVAEAVADVARAEAAQLVNEAAGRALQRLLDANAAMLQAEIDASAQAEAAHMARLQADDEWLLMML